MLYIGYPKVLINDRYETCTPVIIDGCETDYVVTLYGNVYSLKTHKVLKYSRNHKGYDLVRIYHNGTDYTKQVHRLIATAFIPNPDNKPQVNHIDGDKDNNSVLNLEWVTNDENIKHAVSHNLRAHLYGITNGNSKYTDIQIHNVCKFLEENNLTINDISKLTGVSCDTIEVIKLQKQWTHISKLYKIDNHTKDGRSPYTSKFKDGVVEMILCGKSNLEIMEILNLDHSNKTASFLYKMRKRLKK